MPLKPWRLRRFPAAATMASLALLSLYPDSGHGALFQHAPVFVEQTARFLA
jgi:hypothetical protein